MNKNQSRIRSKIMAIIMMTSGIVLVMTCTAFFLYEYYSAYESEKRQMTTIGRIIASNSTAAVLFQSPEDAAEILSSLQAKPAVVSACLYDNQGKIIATYPRDLAETEFPKLAPTEDYQFNNGNLEGYEPLIIENKQIGMLYLKSSMERLNERFTLYALIAAAFIAISFVFAYFVSKRLQTTISNPILDLAGISRKVSEERNYSVRAEKTSDDEIGELTDAFNHMLTRIEIQNDQITKLNQNLEQKVRERTAELEMAISQLKKETDFSGKLFDSTVDLIAVFDTELRYVTMNSHAEAMYGKTREETRGKRLQELFPQTVQSGMVDDLRAALKGELVRQLNYRSLVTHRTYENYYVPLRDDRNRVYSVIAIAHDITDIVQANEKLKLLNAELEKSNSELEQFAYVASHDLQEPLRKIQTFSELGERNIDNPEVLRKYLNKVSSSAQRMTELIKAVLNYSRLLKADDEFVEVDLNVVLENIFQDLELLIAEKNAEITYDELPVVRGIPLQLHQLMMNLITNSLKFSARTPKVTITSRIALGSEFDPALALNETASYLMLSFSDNGMGFESKFADKIFSIFQRLHHDKNIAGTGIGLALCKKIVENHGGVITVESVPDEGTTFYIYLPHTVEKAEPQLMNTSSTKK